MLTTNELAATRESIILGLALPAQRQPLTAPTNRQRSTPTIDEEAINVGVDTIRVRGRVTEASLSGMPLQSIRRHLDIGTGAWTDAETGGRAQLDGNLRLSVENRRFGPVPVDELPTAVVEVSVPRFLRGDNTRPASLPEVKTAINRIYGMAAEYVDWIDPADDLRIDRVDLARDFTGVAAIPQLLRDLSELAPMRVPTTHTYLTPDCRGVQSLYRETSRWLVRLYDRREYYLAAAVTRDAGRRAAATRLADQDAGKVRYELQIKGQLARESGLRRIVDLTDSTMARLARQYFVRCRLDQRVGGDPAGWQAAVDRLRLDGNYRKLTSMVGQLWVDEMRLEQPKSRNTRTGHRQLAAAVGLHPHDLWRTGTCARRLDFTTGRLLTGPAALEESA